MTGTAPRVQRNALVLYGGDAVIDLRMYASGYGHLSVTVAGCPEPLGVALGPAEITALRQYVIDHTPAPAVTP